jgi:hypothetical protein
MVLNTEVHLHSSSGAGDEGNKAIEVEERLSGPSSRVRHFLRLEVIR